MTNRAELDAVITYAAAQAVAMAEGDPDLASESWIALPEHLKVMINKAQKRLREQERKDTDDHHSNT